MAGVGVGAGWAAFRPDWFLAFSKVKFSVILVLSYL